MGHLLYYAPKGITIRKHADLVRVGLGYATDGRGGPLAVGTPKGPDGLEGVFFVLPLPDGSHPPLQDLVGRVDTWAECETDVGIQVGFVSSDPPTPKDLERKIMFPGTPVRLADGTEWSIAIARYLDGSTALPLRASRKNGEWVFDAIDARYSEFWNRSLQYFNCIMGVDGAPLFEAPDELDFAAAALSVNYRISPAEIGLLGLFDTNVAHNISMEAVDFSAIKKKAEESMRRNVEHGLEASCPDTGPASRNSGSNSEDD